MYHVELQILKDGTWTIQLKDVRDEIGNFYDEGDDPADGIQHKEWTIDLY